eukprot:CAMPEP_0116021066 /NCGR_PEP_ID=MMETSP0321-20121206/10165_1 /TAXON_ID=163516 /ORGANISM="Leptocylindrus danicus var. danicus, Strain B650" /LENGTH=633 /DNA_ID=CAMNT_0003491865 /DNA_START=38 /DNA_END=1939 /DNA_ORIENTATION=+
MSSLSTTADAAQNFVNSFNVLYAEKHKAFEEQFWGTKMNLSEGEYSTDLLASTKSDMEALLADNDMLQKAKGYLNALDECKEVDEDLAKTLGVIVRSCQCYNMGDDPSAQDIRNKTSKLEGELGEKRNFMKLGYTNSSGKFVESSSVALRNKMRTSNDESDRKAAYEGLRSIGPFVCSNGFCDIVKLRNQLAKSLGKEDYYDYTIQNAEGFSKKRLFEILDDLEEKTRPLMQQAREELSERHGVAALEPHNMGFMMAGSVIQKMDPYFPFSKSVEMYARSYAAMKIDYKGAEMCLDLLDRKGKYSNGFCHWPVPAWVKPDGSWQPSRTNFTSLADPSAVGSGHTALITLMHEAGHAAHFANIKQPSPLFSQERAPTSVAYAENQSMFLDSLVEDAAWMAHYARNSNGDPIPFDIVEERIKSTHPFAVFQLRAMLAVSYFEKALYELPDEEVTPERVMQLADEVEKSIQGGFSPRPLLSVPHILSDEASCYYQGYTLAEMSVHQTREWFKKQYGFIVDNPKVGPTLEKAYWECGNSKNFLDIVRDLTGKDLSGDAWTAALKESVEDRITRERAEYDEMISKLSSGDAEENDIDLNMVVEFKDGDELIGNSSNGGLLSACKKFEAFVASKMSSDP